jgi:hypothetical protein
MDAALALLIAIVEVDCRFRTGSVLVPSVSLAEVVALATAFTGLLVALAMKRYAVRGILSAAIKNAPAVVPYWASVAVVAAGGLVLGSTNGLHALKDQMPAGVVLSLFLLLPATSGRQQRAELALSGVALAVVVLAVIQAFFGGPYLVELNVTAYTKQVWDTSGLISNPVAGPFAHPNSLAVFLVPVGVLAAGRTLDSLRGRRMGIVPIVHLACASGALLALFLGGAKLGLGTLVLGIAFRVGCEMLGLRCTVRRALAGLLALVLCLAATIILWLGAATARGLDYKAGTLADRWLLDVRAVRFLADQPRVLALGGGDEAFVQSTPLRLQVHNEFLLQVVQFGLLSGALFVVMVVAAYVGMGVHAWSYSWALSGLVAMLLVEPASGTQMQGVVMTVIGLCALQRRLTVAKRNL